MNITRTTRLVELAIERLAHSKHIYDVAVAVQDLKEVLENLKQERDRLTSLD